MDSQLPDPDRSGPFAPPPRRGGSWVAPLLVSFVSLAGAAALGLDRLEHVVATGPGSGSDLLLLATLAIAMVAALVLVARLVRPKVDEPLAQAPASVQPPTPLPMTKVPTVSAERRGQLRRIRTAYTVFAGIVPLIFLAMFVYQLTTRSDSIPSAIKGIGGGSERACPRAPAGDDPLDSARTDCMPLDGDEVFEPGPTSIQEAPYVGIEHDATTDCADVAASLSGSTCSQVVRGLYETEDGRIHGAVSILVFDELRDAERAAPTLDAREVGLDPADARRLGWDGPRARGTCIPSVGRYVTCIHTVHAVDAAPEEAIVAARHLNLLATDVLVARRFALP